MDAVVSVSRIFFGSTDIIRPGVSTHAHSFAITMSKYRDLPDGFAYRISARGLSVAKNTAKTRRMVCIPRNLWSSIGDVLSSNNSDPVETTPRRGKQAKHKSTENLPPDGSPGDTPVKVKPRRKQKSTDLAA